MSKITVVVDSTQLVQWMECPQQWYYSSVERIIPNEVNLKKSDAKTQGSWGHKLLERYYKKRAEKLSMQDALEFALSVRADQVCECGHDLEEHKEILLHDAYSMSKVSECQHAGCTCTNPKSSTVEIDPKEKELVSSRVREYVYSYNATGDFAVPNPDCVEVGFSQKIYEDDEFLFVLEGKIDLLTPTFGTFGEIGFADHKFQTKESTLYKKTIQFRNYGLVTNAKMAVVNYVRLKKNFDKTTLVRDIITYQDGEHTWWRKQLIGYFSQIARQQHTLKVLQTPLPKHWNACQGSYYGECFYTQLCTERDDSMRQRKHDVLYKIKPEWKPW